MKSLKKLGYDLTKTVVIDDKPSTYRDNPENALEIPPWHNENKDDKALLDVLKKLGHISFNCDDIRKELAKLRYS